jgi:hypothetical protein
MSTKDRTQADRRWLDWVPRTSITAISAEHEPTKPSESSSVGFDGSASAILSKIEGPESLPAQDPTPLNHTSTSVDSVTAQERVMSCSEWKAAALNRLFLEQGTSGQPGRIIAETVSHGERHQEAAKAPATEGI